MAGDAVRPRRPRPSFARWSGDERQSRSASWPGLTRPSRLALPRPAPLRQRGQVRRSRSLDGRVKPGHDGGLGETHGDWAERRRPHRLSRLRRSGAGVPQRLADAAGLRRARRRLRRQDRLARRARARRQTRRLRRGLRRGRREARRLRLPARRWSSPSSPPTRPKPPRSPPCPASLATLFSSTAIPARRKPRRARQAKSRRRVDAMSTSP